MDGLLLMRTGSGAHRLSARQLCNLVYALRLQGCATREEREEFLEELRLPLDPIGQADQLWPR